MLKNTENFSVYSVLPNYITDEELIGKPRRSSAEVATRVLHKRYSNPGEYGIFLSERSDRRRTIRCIREHFSNSDNMKHQIRNIQRMKLTSRY